MSLINSIIHRAATFTKFGNVYTSSTNGNDPVYTELPDLIIFMMQIGKIADIFPKKKLLEKCTLRENLKLVVWVL